MNSLKTYGAPGLMEWQAQIKVGKATFNFCFSGGTLTGYGVTPALYATKNKVYQAIIESSDYFKNGKITLVRELPIEGDEAEAKAEVAEEQPKTEAVEDADGMKVIKVSCLEDARQILINDYRVAPTKILTEAKVMARAKSKGVKFVIG